jgi:cytochrome c oxidase cbb3-type subunit 1
VVNAWYVGNLANLWLTPLALAGIFYFIPRLTGQPLFSRELAAFGFWTLAFFANFTGLAGLIGGPVPRWIPSVSTAANFCLLVALVANGLNWYWTKPCSREECRKNVALRFIFFGAGCYLLNGLLAAVYSVPTVSAVVQFTYATAARNYLVILGSAGMVLFGCLYYIVPRLAQVNWPNEKWIRGHFLLSAIGLSLLVVGLTLGGVIQGNRLANAEIPFLSIVRGTVPFVGLSTLGILLLLAGQCLFLVNLFKLLYACCEPICRTICAEYCCGSVTKAGVKS